MTRVFARDEPGVMFNSVDPGYCATDQNDNQGILPPDAGARLMCSLALDDLPAQRTGKFFSYNGAELDWLRT